MNIKLRLTALLFLLSFFFQKNNIAAQTIDVTLLAAENMSSLYQLDTSGLGENVVVTQDLNSIGSVRFISIIDGFKMNYVSRDGLGEFCCVNVNLTGDQGSRDYRFTFKIIQPALPANSFFEEYILKDSTEIFQIPILDFADTVFTDIAAVDSIVNYKNFGNVNIEYIGSNGIYVFFELSGKNHGREVNQIQLCNVDGSQCESYSLTTTVMDTSRINLPAQFERIGDFCRGGVRTSFCSEVDLDDMRFSTLEYRLDGAPFGIRQDTCGDVQDAIFYNIGIPFLRPPNRFRIESWVVDGTVYTGSEIETREGLLLFMKKHFPDQKWESRGGRIQGLKGNINFGELILRELTTDEPYDFAPMDGTMFIPQVLFKMPIGEYDFSIHYPDYNYTTTTSVKIECTDLDPSYYVFRDTIFPEDTVTVYDVRPRRLEFYQLGNHYSFDNPTGAADFELEQNFGFWNFTYVGKHAGTSKYLIEFCDVLGLCDSLAYEIVVLDFPSGNITFTTPPEPNKIINCGEPVSFLDIEAVSTCRLDSIVVITYRDSVATLGCANHKIDYRFWTLTDRCGGVLNYTQTIETVDNDPPIIVSAPDDLDLECFDMIPFDEPVFMDDCGFNIQVVLKDSISINSCPDVQILRIWTATDDCGNATIYTQNITKKNEGPFLMMPSHPVIDLPCGDSVAYDPPEFVHECGLDFTVTFEEFVTNTDCQQFEITRIWTATDDCGLISTDEQFLMYMDDEAPMFVGDFPQNITIDETAGEEIPPFWQPMATDNCDDAVDINFSETMFKSPTDDNNIEIHRNYQAMDDCGNMEMHIQEITIVTDPVWPGDTDDDGDVDGADLFPVGFAFGERGRRRPESDWFFHPQASLNWEKNFMDSINFKHIDSDGTGEIDYWDTMAIQINWGLNHPKFVPVKPAKVTEDLRVDFVEEIGDSWVKADIILGNDLGIISDFYGLTFDIEYNAGLFDTDSTFIDYSDSWAGVLNTDLLTVQKNFADEKTIRTSLVRTDGAGISNEGKIARLYLKMKTPRPSIATLEISIPAATGVYSNGEEYSTLPFQHDWALTASTNQRKNQNLFQLSPNPTNGEVTINLGDKNAIKYQVKVTGLLGKTLQEFETKNQSKFKIDLSDFPEGTYFIRVSDGEFFGVKKVIRQ